MTLQDVHILLGKGNGAFRDAGTFPVGKSAGGLAVGDFNHDGKLDVAAALEDGTVNVLLGNGDGTFQAPKGSHIDSYTGTLAVGDFNHDGKLDLVGIPSDQFEKSVIQVLLGNGDGTFQPPVDYTVNANPRSIAVADFNYDGKLDLAVSTIRFEADPGHIVSVLLGNGAGTFQPRVDFETGNQPFAITSADLNGDGNLDLATANFIDGTVSVLFGKGDGTFRPAGTYAVSHPFALYGIAAMPFESGDKPGLAVATLAGTFIMLNNGDGTFQPAQGYDPGSVDVLVADFNGDGKADLALVAGQYDTDSGIAIVLGLGKGAFATSTAYVAVPNAKALAKGDFNGDGIPDLVKSSLDSPYYLGVTTGDGQGHFSEPVQLYNMRGSPGAIAAADLNGDGKLDLAVTIEGPDEVQILLGNGDGTFTPAGGFKFLGNWPGWIALKDFNGDGILDIAVTSTGDYGSKGAVSVLLGTGNATFSPAVGYAFDEGPAGIAGLTIADFNRDGKLDFAVADNIVGKLRVFLGKGDEGFQPGSQTAIGPNVSDLAAADFNGDGDMDLSLPTGNYAIEVLLGNGDGTFGESENFPSLPAYWVTAADFNSDGKADLASYPAKVSCNCS